MSISPGQSIIFNDTRGVIWFGIAVSSTIFRASGPPVLKVRVGSKTVQVLDRSVCPWPDHVAHDQPADALARPSGGPAQSGDALALPARTGNLGRSDTPPLNLGDIISTVEPIDIHAEPPIPPAAIGVIIGCVSPAEFIIRLDAGLTTRVFAHQIAAYRPIIPEFI